MSRIVYIPAKPDAISAVTNTSSGVSDAAISFALGKAKSLDWIAVPRLSPAAGISSDS